MVIHTFTQSICYSILNQHGFVKDVNITSFEYFNITMSCACSKFDPKHADKNNQDILTGDLGIISNSKLKKLIFKGLKYRETVNIF